MFQCLWSLVYRSALHGEKETSHGVDLTISITHFPPPDTPVGEQKSDKKDGGQYPKNWPEHRILTDFRGHENRCAALFFTSRECCFHRVGFDSLNSCVSPSSESGRNPCLAKRKFISTSSSTHTPALYGGEVFAILKRKNENASVKSQGQIQESIEVTTSFPSVIYGERRIWWRKNAW